MKENIFIAQKSDLPQIHKLQYEAFGRVAEVINNYDLPPLKQTLSQMEEEFQTYTTLKYCIDGRIVGSIRGRLDDEKVCHIGVLIVATDFQNMGIGRALIEAIETQFLHCKKYSLFTSPETPNTSYLYSKLGYKEVSRGDLKGINMIFMEKEI